MLLRAPHGIPTRQRPRKRPRPSSSREEPTARVAAAAGLDSECAPRCSAADTRHDDSASGTDAEPGLRRRAPAMAAAPESNEWAGPVATPNSLSWASNEHDGAGVVASANADDIAGGEAEVSKQDILDRVAAAMAAHGVGARFSRAGRAAVEASLPQRAARAPAAPGDDSVEDFVLSWSQWPSQQTGPEWYSDSPASIVAVAARLTGASTMLEGCLISNGSADWFAPRVSVPHS